MKPVFMNLSVLVLVLSLAAPPLAIAQTFVGDGTWRLVYVNNADGEAVHGQLYRLVDAVRAGYPVRVGWGGRTVEHVANAEFLTITGGEVFAQIAPILTQTPTEDPPDVRFRDGATQWRAIFGTTGAFNSVVSGGEPRAVHTHVYWYTSAPVGVGAPTPSLTAPPPEIQ